MFRTLKRYITTKEEFSKVSHFANMIIL